MYKSITSASEAESITSLKIGLLQNSSIYYQSRFCCFHSTHQTHSSKSCSPSVSLLCPLLSSILHHCSSDLPDFPLLFCGFLSLPSPLYWADLHMITCSVFPSPINLSISEPNFVDAFPKSYTCLTSSYPHSWLCHPHASLLLMPKQLLRCCMLHVGAGQ